MKQHFTLDSFLLLLTAAIWGAAFVAQRSGMEAIGPMTFTAARMLLAALAVGLLSLARGGKRPLTRQELAGGLLCGLFLGAASLAQQMGVVTTTAGKAGFITALYMVLVPLLNLLLFRKTPPPAVWPAVVLGVTGLGLLSLTEALRLSRGDGLVCLCALLFSGHILVCDRFAAQGDPLRISALQFLTAALLSGGLALPLERPVPAQLLAAAVPILYCGLLSGGLGYTLQLLAQRRTEPAVASLLLSLESVFAALTGALVLGERMTGREKLGCALMFAAILLVQLPGLRSRQEKTGA